MPLNPLGCGVARAQCGCSACPMHPGGLQWVHAGPREHFLGGLRDEESIIDGVQVREEWHADLVLGASVGTGLQPIEKSKRKKGATSKSPGCSVLCSDPTRVCTERGTTTQGGKSSGERRAKPNPKGKQVTRTVICATQPRPTQPPKSSGESDIVQNRRTLFCYFWIGCVRLLSQVLRGLA